MPPSSPPDEPRTPSRSSLPAPPVRPRYVPTGPPPGPQHSRATGSTFWHVTRIVALCVLAIALVTVPVAWVQRGDAPARADAAQVAGASDEPTADELGFSLATPAP